MATALTALTAAASAGRDLASAEAAVAAMAMADGAIPDADKAAFLLALARKGETAGEVAGFARTYRDLARQVDFGDLAARGIDIVGTGGDRSGSFNISSASALIVAAAGVPVLKHGNRSITSKSGSADFLAGLGVTLDATDDQLRRALTEANFCYLYAPAFHPAFKAVLGVRKQLAEGGNKTIFNVLGPLINPARPAHMVVGVYDERWVAPLAAALGERGGSPEENIAMFSDLLVGGVTDGLLDTLCLSAGTALWVAGRAAGPAAGAIRAREIILGGELRAEVRRLREAYRAD